MFKDLLVGILSMTCFVFGMYSAAYFVAWLLCLFLN